MFNVSGKTARILAAFTAASVACVAAGCSDEDELASLDYEYEDEQMVDDAGNPYTLHRNEDGTETAVYDDGREVTFRRDENNNLNFVSGISSFMACSQASRAIMIKIPAAMWPGGICSH